jgi:hypothetical protein
MAWVAQNAVERIEAEFAPRRGQRPNVAHRQRRIELDCRHFCIRRRATGGAQQAVDQPVEFSEAISAADRPRRDRTRPTAHHAASPTW